jgi:hypothetical protein
MSSSIFAVALLQPRVFDERFPFFMGKLQALLDQDA